MELVRTAGVAEIAKVADTKALKLREHCSYSKRVGQEKSKLQCGFRSGSGENSILPLWPRATTTR